MTIKPKKGLAEDNVADVVKIENARSQALAKKQLQKSQLPTNSASNAALQTTDTVKVGLAHAIASELNPDSMIAERAQRVQQLKSLIASGQYKPKSEEVAKSLGQELILEILGGGQQPAE